MDGGLDDDAADAKDGLDGEDEDAKERAEDGCGSFFVGLSLDFSLDITQDF